jgi:hypothetical protein
MRFIVIIAIPFVLAMMLNAGFRWKAKAGMQIGCTTLSAPVRVDLVSRENAIFIRCTNALYADMILRLYPEAGVTWDTRVSQSN